jgi:hypothetical protein
MASHRFLIFCILLLAGGTLQAQSSDASELARHRIRLADRFAILANDIPEALRADSVGRMQAVRNNGYRIQIVNSRDVREAEAVRAAFEEWASLELEPNTVFSYVLYKQPFYRVHAGDFRSRNKAQEFANRVKERFPDAWVVVDQVIPERVR